MKSDTVIAYTFKADQYCPICIVPEVGTHTGILIENQDTELYLDDAASQLGIDRYDERTFDSGDFPKVVFSVQMEEDEFCGTCGEVL